jgi:hypothetical protein
LDKSAHLLKELDSLIDRFKSESEKHKLLNRRLRYLVFTLTGCAAILSAAALRFPGYQTSLNFGVVLVSVGAGIVTSIEGLRKAGELWIIERNVFHALSDLKRELEFEMDRLTDPQLDLYFGRMQGILASSTEQWTRQVRPHTKAE